MWRILSLSILLALTNGTSVFAHERLAGRHSPPELWRQLAQAAPPATIDQRALGEARPEAMRQCLQQALFWLGRYQGPVDGQASPAYIEALQAYAADRGLELRTLETSPALLRSLEHALATLGKVEAWQACREGAEPGTR
jgi:uncharacterized membrane protein